MVQGEIQAARVGLRQSTDIYYGCVSAARLWQLHFSPGLRNLSLDSILEELHRELDDGRPDVYLHKLMLQFQLPHRPVLKHGPRSLTYVRVFGYFTPVGAAKAIFE